MNDVKRQWDITTGVRSRCGSTGASANIAAVSPSVKYLAFKLHRQKESLEAGYHRSET
jgi:uncharacterized membrane protein